MCDGEIEASQTVARGQDPITHEGEVLGVHIPAVLDVIDDEDDREPRRSDGSTYRHLYRISRIAKAVDLLPGKEDAGEAQDLRPS